MLCDSFNNWRTCLKGLKSAFDIAFSWIQEQLKNPSPVGRYDLSKGVYALIQNYITKNLENAKFENHRKFIDVQIVTQGIEWIYWTKPRNLPQTDPYIDAKDAEFFLPAPDINAFGHLVLEPGLFAVFWPGDLHLPGVSPQNIAAPQSVVKLVVKVPVIK